MTLTVHTQALPHTFDVRINGAPTGCTGTTSRIGPPFNSVSVMDPSNEGWGGDVLFDCDLRAAARAPNEPTGSLTRAI